MRISSGFSCSTYWQCTCERDVIAGSLCVTGISFISDMVIACEAVSGDSVYDLTFLSAMRILICVNCGSFHVTNSVVMCNIHRRSSCIVKAARRRL